MSDHEPDFDEGDFSEDDAEGDEHERELGYTSEGGFTTGDEDEPDIFDSYLDPLCLLRQMEQGVAQEAEMNPGGAALEPYQVLRNQRAGTRRRQRGGGKSDERGFNVGGGHEDEERWEVEDPAGPSGPDPGGRQRPVGGVFGADVDDIMMDPLAAQLGLAPSSGKARRRRKKRRAKAGSRSRQLPEHVGKKLGEANLMYATRRYAEATNLLMEVIQECPNTSDPFHTLGLIYEAQGDARRALDFYMIAAHLTPKDISLWRRLASLSTELGFFRQGIYCLTKVIGRNKGDLDARWDRAVLYAEVGETSRAISQFQQIGVLRSGDPEVPKMMARLHHRIQQPQMAMEALEGFMHKYPHRADMTHINILSELYMESGRYEETYSLIQTAERMATGGEDGNTAAEAPAVMPLDLTVKAGLCLARMGRMPEAESYFAALLDEPEEQYGDLYLEAADALMAIGQYGRAVGFLEKLEPLTQFQSTALWEKLLQCYRALGRIGDGISLYRQRMAEIDVGDERYPDICLALAEMYRESGSANKAQQLLQHLDEIRGAPPDNGGSEQQRGEEGAGIDDGDAMRCDEGYESGERRGGFSGARPPCSSLPQSHEEVSQFMRRTKLLMQLGLHEAYISWVLPLVQDSLSLLEEDVAVAKNVTLPPELVKAVHRRRLVISRGGRRGEGAEETESVFKGAVRRDRRSSKTLQADRQLEAYLATSAGETDAEGGGGGEARAAALAAGSLVQEWGGAAGAVLSRSLLVQEEYLVLFLDLARALILKGQASEAVSLLTKAQELCGQQLKWFPRCTLDRIALALTDAHSASGQPGAAMALLRGLVVHWPASVAAWSRYCRDSAKAGTVRSWAAHVATMRRRCPASLPVMIMGGHVHNMYRMYSEALSEYFHAYRYWPTEPLLLLSIAVAYLNLATTKKVPDRNRAVLTGFAFMQEYSRQRVRSSTCTSSVSRDAQEILSEQADRSSEASAIACVCSQEAAYNMGRAAHHLGLNHVASHFYKKALLNSCGEGHRNLDGLPAGPSSEREMEVSLTDAAEFTESSIARCPLSPESAHNLALIYASSGSEPLARELYRTYLVF